MRKTKQILIGAITISIFLGISFLDLGKSINYRLLDFFQRDNRPHPDIVIIAVDNSSLETIGRWPWDRSVHANLVRILSEKYEPRALGLDVQFFETQRLGGDQDLKNAIDRTEFPVVLVSEAIFVKGKSNPDRIIKPLSYFSENKKIGIGHVNLPENPDGISRQAPLELHLDDGTPSIPFVYALARELGDVSEQFLDKKWFIDFAGPAGTFPIFPYTKVLSGEVDPQSLRDKIVLVGATASGLRDYLLAPIEGQALSGVEWQANVLDNILLGKGIVPLNKNTHLLIELFLGLFILTVLQFGSRRWSSIIFLALLVLIPLASFIMWQFGLGFLYLWPLFMIVALFIVHSIYQWYVVSGEKRKLNRTMKLYFSPQVLDHVLKHPHHLKLGGERREVTVFFSDIRSFTTITEQTDPAILSQLLHEYFTEMTEEILKTDGVVDKFIGDAIMAFWGAPIEQDDQADRAIRASIAMLKKLPRLREKWKAKGWPEVRIGIGLATGFATVGNMGSAKRFDYTVIGDSVNLAARLESATKEYKTEIVVSESTKNKVRGDYDFELLGSTTVKGKTEAVNVYTIKFD